MASVQAGVKTSLIDLGRAPSASVLLACNVHLDLSQEDITHAPQLLTEHHTYCCLQCKWSRFTLYFLAAACIQLHASRSSATSTGASVSLVEVQVNEGLSDSPADLLDFSMKQELEQVHDTMLPLGMHSVQCCRFLICSNPCSCLNVH